MSPKYALIALTLACFVAASMPGAQAATSGFSVNATVQSQTSFSAAGCPPGVAGVTALGAIAVRNGMVGSLTCDLTAGSSNDSTRLRVYQTDGAGVAMFASTTGVPVTAGFGAGGRAYASVLSGSARGTDMAVQPDGKLVVVGSASNGTNTDVVVARFLSNGTLDPAFDGDSGTGNGVVTTHVNGNDAANGVDLDSTGRIVVAGTTNPGGPNSLVIRYHTDGRLDTSFNGTGIREEDLGAQDGYLDVDVRSDDRIVVGGFNGGYVNGIVDVLDTNGSHWAGFNGGGRLQVRSPGANFEQVRQVRAQPDGSVLTIARRESPAPQAFVAYRALANGTGVDPNFGTGGWTTVTFAGGNVGATDVVEHPGGGWVVAGHDPNDMVAIRLTAAGLHDTTWGTSGYFTQSIGGAGDVAARIVAETDGSFALAGTAGGGNFGLARFSSTGIVDPRIPSGVSIDMGGSDGAGGAALLPDGEIYVAGHDGTRLAVARLAGTPLDNYSSATNGFLTGPGSSGFGACLDTLTGGTAMWTEASGCPATDAGHWNPIAINSLEATSSIARRTTPGGPDMQVKLRFGLYAGSSQKPTNYVAPITFEVTAPDG